MCELQLYKDNHNYIGINIYRKEKIRLIIKEEEKYVHRLNSKSHHLILGLTDSLCIFYILTAKICLTTKGWQREKIEIILV